jgi:hypothetical protein
MHFFYLHGFASSAQSSKARFFADRLARHGMALHCPDFNEPDFSTLTITRMIGQVIDRVEQLPPGPLVLIGSSLGAFVAVQVAGKLERDRDRPIARLILLAPALELAWERWSQLGPGGIERWRAMGRLDVFHYGFGKVLPVGFALYEDSRRYDAFSAPGDCPTLIFQGLQDDAVDPKVTERFAQARSNRTLYMLNDGHQLLDSLELIWSETARALGL